MTPMRSASAALAAVAICGLAHAEPMRLNDRQLDSITAGAAAGAVFRSVASGKDMALNTLVGNLALENPRVSFAQSRTAILGTGTSVSTVSVNWSSTQASTATAATTTAASGDSATARSLGVTTALGIALPGGSRAVANALAYSFSSAVSR
jgi:hypothetical protein